MTAAPPLQAGSNPPPLCNTERLARLRLARTKGIGIATFTKLLGLYGTAEHAIAALPERARLSGKAAPAVPSLAQIEDEIAWLSKRNACHILRSDPSYPQLLSALPKAPILLFARGDTALLSAPSLAIVGARNASSPALDLAEHFSEGLAQAGLTIISGLARGIDGAAHRAALPFKCTIAALPGGLDTTYPPEHRDLQEEIALNGCLLTEYPPGTMANARHFPRRNHLIAGLSRGCLLIEAAQRSGTLITARLALTYQRPLFVVPGFPKDPRSNGGNDLLRHNKAHLVEHVQDILTVLEHTQTPPRHPAAWSRPTPRQTSLFSPTQPASKPQSPASPSPTSTNAGAHAAPTGVSSLPKKYADQPLTQNRSHNEFHLPVETPSLAIPKKVLRNSHSSPLRGSQNGATTHKKNILSLLAHTPCTVDEIASRCQLSISDVAAILIELEVNGDIQRHADGQITRLN